MVEGGEDALALCVEILKEGYADAFVQFYDLAPKDPPSPRRRVQLLHAPTSGGLQAIPDERPGDEPGCLLLMVRTILPD